MRARFWRWYERHYLLNVGAASLLFLLQLVHLVWLFGDVVWLRLAGEELFELSGVWRYLIIAVDYTEIPALISISLVYAHTLREGLRPKDALYLLFINLQWLHLFWITDEFVIAALTGERGTALPLWLAWVAIGIDYLEVPVIAETLRRFTRALRARRSGEFLR